MTGDFGTVHHLPSLSSGYTTTDQSNPCGRDAYALELHGILIPVDGFSALRAMALFMLNMICACCRLFRRWNSIFQLGISMAPRVESRCYSSCFSRHTSGERRPPFRYGRTAGHLQTQNIIIEPPGGQVEVSFQILSFHVITLIFPNPQSLLSSILFDDVLIWGLPARYRHGLCASFSRGGKSRYRHTRTNRGLNSQY